MGIYPARLRQERDCLNCGEPFPPGPDWQAIYCSLACWRANNGGPRQPARLPPPTLVPARFPEPPAEQQVLERAASQGLPVHVPGEAAPPPQRRLVVVAREYCSRCQVDHDIYGMTDG